jgi:hypothetical protein
LTAARAVVSLSRDRATRVLLVERDDGQAIRASFRREIEIRDLRILLLQERHEDFVQRDAEDCRLVRRLARVRGVIDRIAA